MALDNVKFLQGTSAKYQALLAANSIVDSTFYYTIDEVDGVKSYALYLGKTLLSNGTLENDVATLQTLVNTIVGNYPEGQTPVSIYELEQAIVSMNSAAGFEGRLKDVEISRIPELQAAIDELGEDITALENGAKFDSNIRLTEDFGKYKVDASKGYVEVPTEGKTANEVILLAFQTAENPTADQVTAPAVSLTCSQGNKEVGSKVTPTFSASLGAGSYPYGPATGIVASSWEVTIANTGEAAKTTASGSFGEIEIIDGMSDYAKVTAKATWDMDGTDPNNNLGSTAGNAADIKIKAGSDDAVSSGYTGFRGWFYGYKKNNTDISDPESITSDQVRALGSGVKTSIPSTLTTDNMQQMYFAIPKKADGTSQKSSITVVNNSNGAGAGTVIGPVTVYVKGANQYAVAKNDDKGINTINGYAYDLFYINNDNPETGSTTWKITTK